MAYIEKEACPEKKDFLWRERLSLISFSFKNTFLIQHVCLYCIEYIVCLYKPGLLYVTIFASTGVFGDVSQGTVDSGKIRFTHI